MIEHLSRLIAKSLYNNTAEKSSSEEIEMLQYGIECIINILIPLIIIFIYAFLSHKTLDMFIWFLSFLLLRNFIGGYHTSSHIRCIILSSFVSLCIITNVFVTANLSRSTALFLRNVTYSSASPQSKPFLCPPYMKLSYCQEFPLTQRHRHPATLFLMSRQTVLIL